MAPDTLGDLRSPGPGEGGKPGDPSRFDSRLLDESSASLLTADSSQA